MIFDSFELHASPFFSRVLCPKHRNEMIELDNGWFSKCWYCKQCEYPYELKFLKMKKVNKENLKKALEEKKVLSKTSSQRK